MIGQQATSANPSSTDVTDVDSQLSMNGTVPPLVCPTFIANNVHTTGESSNELKWGIKAGLTFQTFVAGQRWDYDTGLL